MFSNKIDLIFAFSFAPNSETNLCFSSDRYHMHIDNKNKPYTVIVNSSLSDFGYVTFKSCRCGWPVLVCEQCWAGVLRRWGAWGFLCGTAGAWSPRHPWQERKIPAWRPGRHTEGRRTQSEQLSPLGVLKHPILAAPQDLTPLIFRQLCRLLRWKTVTHQRRVTACADSISLLSLLPATKRSQQRVHRDNWLIGEESAIRGTHHSAKRRLNEVNSGLSQGLTLKQQN